MSKGSFLWRSRTRSQAFLNVLQLGCRFGVCVFAGQSRLQDTVSESPHGMSSAEDQVDRGHGFQADATFFSISSSDLARDLMLRQNVVYVVNRESAAEMAEVSMWMGESEKLVKDSALVCFDLPLA